MTGWFVMPCIAFDEPQAGCIAHKTVAMQQYNHTGVLPCPAAALAKFFSQLQCRSTIVQFKGGIAGQ